MAASLPSNTENLQFNLDNEVLKRFLQERLSRQKGLLLVLDIAEVKMRSDKMPSDMAVQNLVANSVGL